MYCCIRFLNSGTISAALAAMWWFWLSVLPSRMAVAVHPTSPLQQDLSSTSDLTSSPTATSAPHWDPAERTPGKWKIETSGMEAVAVAVVVVVVVADFVVASGVGGIETGTAASRLSNTAPGVTR